MCGIYAELIHHEIPSLPKWKFWTGTAQRPQSPSGGLSPTPPKSVRYFLDRRGPDDRSTDVIHVDKSSTLHLTQTILSLRGFRNRGLVEGDNRLLYNGELYGGIHVGENDSDTETLLAHLNDKTSNQPLVPESLDMLKGPWAIIYWHAMSKRLYFARDCIGRRSLLMHVIPGKKLILSSVAPEHDASGFVEVPPAGVAYIDVSGVPEFGLYKREPHSVIPRRASFLLRNNGGNEVGLVSGSDIGMYVSFLPKRWLRSKARQICIEPLTVQESVQRFISLFKQSIRRRMVINTQSNSMQPRFAVLFSGGIDSMFISVILESCLPRSEPLQLINVAFGDDIDSINQCPDRITALHGLQELQKMCSGRRAVEMLCVDVFPKQADDALCNNVRHLLHPCDQLMDASIGTAIWLASKGVGYKVLSDLESSKEITKTTVRVLFSGLGADELMGGYKGRHRTIFRNEGIDGILREMDADFSRLWFRNLGRDDRLIADHGREVRHPFLDEDLVEFITQLPLTEHVCDLSKPDGIGDKHLLRRAARAIGISDAAAARSKRAIQFGSRSRHVLERKKKA
ncbi:Asparagine synthase [Gracilaria domingensis]|nr:Asparagine synthase [Gracilaria domingensis]